MSNRIYRDGKFKCYLAKDKDEAYRLGFFSGSIHRDELMERITKFNPTLRWFATPTHRALWDWTKGENGFICGIPHDSIIPKISIMEYNFDKDRRLNYTNMYGETTGSEIINMDEYKYQVLARGWESIFAIVEQNGYEIDKRGL